MLFAPFYQWREEGNIYLLSDLHFDDCACRAKNPEWISVAEQLAIINECVQKEDTFICLGDVGIASYMDEIHAKRKVLLMGNHDSKEACKPYFDIILDGAVFIAPHILLSHEPVFGLGKCLNIHGHEHNLSFSLTEPETHRNLAANICGYRPVTLDSAVAEFGR